MKKGKNYKQAWNKRSKKWVLYEEGVKAPIRDMSETKFPGVPVKEGGEKPQGSPGGSSPQQSGQQMEAKQNLVSGEPPAGEDPGQLQEPDTSISSKQQRNDEDGGKGKGFLASIFGG